jgi:hypothetical protein
MKNAKMMSKFVTSFNIVCYSRMSPDGLSNIMKISDGITGLGTGFEAETY